MPCTALTPGGANSMMIKVGVRDDHTAEARSARRPGRAASAGTAFAGQPVTQTLNPPPPSFETCKTVGNRFICDGARTESYGPDDTGIACASGAGAFDIFDQDTYNQHAIRFYNTDGNLTRRVIHAQRPVRHPARTAHGLALAWPRRPSGKEPRNDQTPGRSDHHTEPVHSLGGRGVASRPTTPHPPLAQARYHRSGVARRRSRCPGPPGRHRCRVPGGRRLHHDRHVAPGARGQHTV